MELKVKNYKKIIYLKRVDRRDQKLIRSVKEKKTDLSFLIRSAKHRKETFIKWYGNKKATCSMLKASNTLRKASRETESVQFHRIMRLMFFTKCRLRSR